MSWTRFREWLEKMSSGGLDNGFTWIKLVIQIGAVAAIVGGALIYVDSRVDAGTAAIRQQMVELRSDVRSQFDFLTEEVRGLRSDIKDGAVFTVSIQGDIDRLAQRLALELDPIGKAVQRTDARLGSIEQMTRDNGQRLARIETRLETEFASFGKGVESLVAAVERLEGSIDNLETTATELRNAVVELTAEVRRRPK